MADDVTFGTTVATPPSGTIVATDEVAGKHYQRVKIALGADGAATDAVGGAGAVSAAVQRVTLASDDPAVALLGTIDADTSALAGAVSGTEMQVDVVGPLPAGTNAIGKLAANSGVDIGDVDVTSVIPGTGASNLGKAEDAVHATGDTGVMALAVRKDTATALAGTDGDYAPLEVDASGRLHVNVGTSALPSGAATAANQDTLGPVSTATLSSLASTATSAQLVASNASRKGLLVYNTDANTLYLKYGITASLTSFTVAIPSSGYWEMPRPVYTGRIDAIWSAAGSGSAYVTEV
jgi:hypothetical protein